MKLVFWFDGDTNITFFNVPREEILKFERFNPDRMVKLNDKVLINMQNVRYVEILED